MRTRMCWADAMILCVASLAVAKSPEMPAVPNVDGRVATPMEIDFFQGQTREPPAAVVPVPVIVPVENPKRLPAPLPVATSAKAIEMAVLHLLGGELAEATRWLTAAVRMAK
jgi:hypothetical protein